MLTFEPTQPSRVPSSILMASFLELEQLTGELDRVMGVMRREGEGVRCEEGRW